MSLQKFLAECFLLVAGLALLLANYWFTYGLWPISWLSFWLCGVAMLVLAAFRLGMKD